MQCTAVLCYSGAVAITHQCCVRLLGPRASIVPPREGRRRLAETRRSGGGRSARLVVCIKLSIVSASLS